MRTGAPIDSAGAFESFERTAESGNEFAHFRANGLVRREIGPAPGNFFWVHSRPENHLEGFACAQALDAHARHRNDEVPFIRTLK